MADDRQLPGAREVDRVFVIDAFDESGVEHFGLILWRLEAFGDVLDVFPSPRMLLTIWV
jgi:hypothetical protein